MADPEVRSVFQCPKCGFGSHEVGHLIGDSEVFCIVCLEEASIQVRPQRWEESGDGKARLREPAL